jgi:polysaccharide biosynthesis protein PelA
VIEAEVRGYVDDQKPGDAEFLTRLARNIFALPKVEAASHSYSHPFYWDENDKTEALYEEQHLQLVDPYNPKRVDPQREVVGSVKFIEENLLPPDKKVKIFLWSGNCRPWPDAIRYTRELGIENMNGGDTIISRKHPSLSKVAPRCMLWKDQLQIYAANQNENVYRERPNFGGDVTGPFLGGFMHALDGFQRMESPRRLKPVNIYFHWYSGDNLASLKALTTLFDWSASQELHSLTASQYARIVRDARATRLFQKSEHHWLLVSEGSLRTFRLPKSDWQPDVAASRGVTGYRVNGEFVYIHTDGSPRVELVLSQNPARHVYLSASTAEVEFEKFQPALVQFSVREVRPCQIILAGFSGHARISVTINDTVSVMTADERGQLHLTLPNEARVTVQAA